MNKVATLSGSRISYTVNISLGQDPARVTNGTLNLTDVMTIANAGDMLSGSLQVVLTNLNVIGGIPAIAGTSGFVINFEETVLGAG